VTTPCTAPNPSDRRPKTEDRRPKKTYSWEHERARRFMMVDPTAIEMDFDPTVQRMKGVTVHGGMPFDVPIISEIGRTCGRVAARMA
jgi:hypothetical protein